MQVIEMPIEQVTPYKNNPRINDDAVQETANSIKEFGWQQPIVVDKNNVIVVGHTRLKAAKQLGLTKVPVVIADKLSDEQVKAYRLADNKVGELAEWNFSDLNFELQELSDFFDMTDFGFSESDIDLASTWEDTGSLDDYEPPTESAVDPQCKCPKCGYTASKKEFSV